MRILLLRLRQIGDVVFTTPALTALRDHFPDATIDYVVEPAATAVVARHPALDHLVVAPRIGGMAGLRDDVRLGARLRRARYDLAIDFHGGPRASLLTWLSRAPRRIGYDIPGRAWMYTERVARARTLAPRHSVENQWDLLRPLGIAAPDRSRYPVTIAVDPEAATTVATRLAADGVPETAPLVLVHVSAGNPFRRWPATSFAAVIQALLRALPTLHVIVTAGPSDAAAVDAVRATVGQALSPDAARRLLTGPEWTLAELRALAERAALYIGGDSGPMHVASASRVPIVSLYGPTLPVRSAPWRGDASAAVAVQVDGLACRPCDQRRCVTGDYRCLTGISAETVTTAALRALQQTS